MHQLPGLTLQLSLALLLAEKYATTSGRLCAINPTRTLRLKWSLLVEGYICIVRRDLRRNGELRRYTNSSQNYSCGLLQPELPLSYPTPYMPCVNSNVFNPQ